MELLYLLVVFLVIVGLLALRRPLYQAMLGACWPQRFCIGFHL